jgi:aryl-alcohol dehydrogenase-like predicted oxidoreductase
MAMTDRELLLRQRPLGASGLMVPHVCLGTMTFGQQTDEKDAHAQLDHALDRGLNFIDAAEMYPVPARAETQGATERIVGRWLSQKPRDRVLLSTKVAGPNRGFAWIRGGPRFDRAQIRAALESSLERLQTDYVDLYQLHWPARNQPMFGQWHFDSGQELDAPPIVAQLEVLSELVREGKVRAVGLSNEHPWGVMKFLEAAEQHGLARIAWIQNAYNLVNRLVDTGGLAEIAFREKVGLLAYSPLAFGHLTGKYLAHPGAVGRITLFPGFGQRYEKPGLGPAIRAYCALARENGLTPTELALGFVCSRELVTSTIVGASSLAQLKENLSACATPIPEELGRRIDELFLVHGNAAP